VTLFARFLHGIARRKEGQRRTGGLGLVRKKREEIKGVERRKRGLGFVKK
jgi:hypothetical protein